MAPYLEQVVAALVACITKDQQHQPSPHLLVQNVCITLGRLGMVCGHQMGKDFAGFAKIWCQVMRNVRLDHEKINAFQGLCNLIKANPQACLGCVPELACAISTLFPAPSHLEPSFREILEGYKQQLGTNWPAVYSQIPQDAQM